MTLPSSLEDLYRSISTRALRQEAEPTPVSKANMETLGSLVDKLCTVSQKMWHNQERLYEIRRMDLDEFIQRYDGKLKELHAIIKRCCDLNVQRAELMDEIDKFMASVTGRSVVREQHKTY